MKTGLIGAVTTFDSLFGFFSKDISTIVSWMILFVIGYNTEVIITQRLLGQFRRKRFMDVLAVTCGCVLGATLVMCVIGPDNPDMLLTAILYSNSFRIIVTLSCVSILFCLIFVKRALAQKSQMTKLEGPVAHFWTLVLGRGMKKKGLREEYMKDKAISNKSVRKLALELWTYGPGLTWFLIIILFAVLFMILSLSSVMFLFSVVFWSIWHSRVFGIEKNILTSMQITITGSGAKGFLGYTVVIVSLLVSTLFFHLLTTLPVEKTKVHGLYFAAPFAYLFFFWYRQGRRLPVFAKLWRERRNHGKRISMPRLPAGGYPVFGLICFLSLVNPLVFSNWYPSPIAWIFSLMISGFVILIIVSSLRRDEKRVSRKNVKRENILIITAVLVHLVCSDLVFWLWLKNISAILSLEVGGLLTFLWFLPDWGRFTLEKHGQKPVTALILFVCMVPLGFSPLLIAGTKAQNLVYLGINLLFAFVFCVGLINILSIPKRQ